MKYKEGDKIGVFKLLSPSKKGHWVTECKCGEVAVRRLAAIKNQKNCRNCKPKLRGNKHYSWRGCGEISHELYTIYKNSATAKNLPFEVSIEYLWGLFIKQNGKCIMTGEELVFNKTSDKLTSRTASPDRIDSTKGYVEGNIQWVHRDVNKLKKNFSDERFLEICLRVANYINRGS